jgi:hypothetical protein
MTDTQRIENLEKRVNALYDIVNRNNFYTGADIAGTQQSVNDITPYKETKTAYIDDTEITFDGVPHGNLTVFFDGDYEAERQADRVVIHFEALEEVKDITIMIQ